MTERPVRWGVLGAAKIAREWLCPAIHNSEDGVLAAIASRSDRGVALARRYPRVKLHDEYEVLLADPEVDAIYIPLPNNQHVGWTEKCLRAGKHVLCEKPIAMEAAEIDRLIAARDETGRLAAEAFMVVHHPQWARAREIVASGEIGELRQVQGAFSFFNDDPANIRNRPEDGGGALRDIGVYPCVVTRFVTGREPVAARSRIEWENGIDATARVWADFEGFSLDFYVSMRLGLRQEMVFHGAKGWLRVRTPFNAKLYGDDVLEVRTGGQTTRLERFPLIDHYTAQIDAFNAAVLEGAEYACPLEFSRGNQAMIDMIYAGEM